MSRLIDGTNMVSTTFQPGNELLADPSTDVPESCFVDNLLSLVEETSEDDVAGSCVGEGDDEAVQGHQ